MWYSIQHKLESKTANSKILGGVNFFVLHQISSKSFHMICWVTIIIAISENHHPTLTQSVKSSWGESWGTSAILSSLNLFRRTASSCHKVFGWQTPSSGSRDSGRSPAPLSPVLILAVLPPPVSHPGQSTPPTRRIPIEGPAKCRPAPPASTSWHPGTISWCQLSYLFSNDDSGTVH